MQRSGTIDAGVEHLLPHLAASRRGIAVGLQEHGHTADIRQPLR
jgi:hypothetical protein